MVPRVESTHLILPAGVVLRPVVEQLVIRMVRRGRREWEALVLVITVQEAEEVGGAEVVLMVVAAVARVTPPVAWFRLAYLVLRVMGLLR